MSSPFGTFNGIEPFGMREGVSLRSVGGEQVLLCRVVYEPGSHVPLHAHELTEQLMLIVDGEVTMTVEGETRTLRAGDTAVVNCGLEHELHSAEGCTFIEALAPVPLDHVADPARDLVLGPEGGAGHVER